MKENGLAKDSGFDNFFRIECNEILHFSGFEIFLAKCYLSFVVFSVSFSIIIQKQIIQS